MAVREASIFGRVTQMVAVAIGVLTCVAPIAVSAQPVQWSVRLTTGPGQLASDGGANLYALSGSTVVKLDFAGHQLWSNALPTWPPIPCGAYCGSGVATMAADAAGAYLPIDGWIGPMSCPLFCGGGAVFWQPGDGSLSSSLYFTPWTQPISAAVAGVAIGSGGELWAFGYDAAGGYLVRLRPTPLELRYGTAMTSAAVLPSGAVVVAGTTGAAAFVRRYSAAGNVDWTTPTTGAQGCKKLALDAAGDVACLSGVVDLLAANGAPVRMGLASSINDITFDAAGNLWAAGIGCGAMCGSLQKFDGNGALIATAVVDDPPRWSEWRAVSAGPNGDVYTTGVSRPPPAQGLPIPDMLTAHFSSDGVQQWLVLVDGKANLTDEGVSVVATADGAVVTGNITDTAGRQDADTLLIIKYGAATLVVPTISLAATPDPVEAGKPFTLTATISAAGAPSGAVTFREGTTVLCAGVPLVAASATTAAANCVVTTMSPGSVQFTASYSGDAAFAAVSASVTVVVTAGVPVNVPAVSPAVLAILSALLAWLGVRETLR